MEQATQSLGERTRRVTAQAQQKAGDQVRSGLDTGKRRAAGALHGVADSLLHGPGDESDGLSRYIQQAGEQVQRAADWLEQTDVEELTHRAEDFARRQPALFIGGAFVVGLVAARFIKSSSRSQQEGRQRASGSGWEPAPLGDVSGSGYAAGASGSTGGMYAGNMSGDMSQAADLRGGGAAGGGQTADLRTSGYGDATRTNDAQTYRDGGL